MLIFTTILSEMRLRRCAPPFLIDHLSKLASSGLTPLIASLSGYVACSPGDSYVRGRDGPLGRADLVVGGDASLPTSAVE